MNDFKVMSQIEHQKNKKEILKEKSYFGMLAYSFCAMSWIKNNMLCMYHPNYTKTKTWLKSIIQTQTQIFVNAINSCNKNKWTFMPHKKSDATQKSHATKKT